jgi:hypothetical protein
MATVIENSASLFPNANERNHLAETVTSGQSESEVMAEAVD